LLFDAVRLYSSQFLQIDQSAFSMREEFEQLRTELKNGRTYILKPGMSNQVADNAEGHKSSFPIGAKLFIVD